MGRVFIDLLRFNRQFAVGVVLLSAITLFALLSFFSPYPPNDSYVVPPDMPPSWAISWARRRAARTCSGC